ncbi:MULTISPECIES: hypothetical protein [Asticcacaulis]|uniref:hypothetical protein n=1 Tax=Asticcacaulis TaxID=76890 RepID=UPI001AE1CBB4|nr:MULTISPECIES: hypothetical protein [Asticcacaulis]MBP2158749.1 hypothetical protein [Asticcacaulis solisilvae]MDR6799795.1 hypothetical protein [Asticcacaulis sp. BE141]
MGRFGFIKYALIAGLLAGSMAAPVMAKPAQTEMARASYAEFRKLAEPLHLIDNIKAILSQQVRKTPETSQMPAKWQAKLAAELDRGVDSRREAVIDLVMGRAAKAFSDEEVTKLRRICAIPAIERYKAGTALAVRSDSDKTSYRKAFVEDPQIRALSEADVKLLQRLFWETGISVDAAMVELGPVISEAFDAANAAS